MKWTKPTHFGVDWEHRGRDSESGRNLIPVNSMPVPYQELSLEEYLKLAFCRPWGPTGEGNFRQVYDLEPPYWDLHIQHYNDYSLAVATTYDEVGLAEKLGALEMETTRRYTHYLRFFRLGCKHEYKEVSHKFAREELNVSTWGMFCHVYHCAKCGHHYSVDSSG